MFGGTDMEDVKKWIAQNKLRTVGTLWVASVGTNLLYQWSRPIPTQLKVIHSRVYAQAFTLAAVGAIGIIEMLDPSLKRKPDDME